MLQTALLQLVQMFLASSSPQISHFPVGVFFSLCVSSFWGCFREGSCGAASFAHAWRSLFMMLFC